jgi:DNA-binding CsgD family transcriptional regulator
VRGREIERVRDELARLSWSALDSVEFRHEAIHLIGRVVPSEAWCWTTADPSTSLVTGAIGEGIPPDRSERFFEIEYLVEDFNKFSDLACRGRPVGVLSEATAGQLDLSARHREIFGPLGIGDDVRLALRVGRSCWGYLVLHRHPARPFTDQEVSFLLSVADHLATGLSLSLTRRAGSSVTSGESGLLLLDSELNTVAVSPAAERYLATMQSKHSEETGSLPDAVRALIAGLNSNGAKDRLKSRVPMKTGGWLSLQATSLGVPRVGAVTAVMIQPASPSELVPLVLEGSGLTAREAEIAGCVLRGLSTDEIASELDVSPQTVQQHLKSVFEKLGVRSRREMLASLFLNHYWPRMASGTPVGSNGWFTRSANSQD